MRKHYIDNLRSFIILLLIPYHAAMSWNTWGEPNYIFFEGNKALSSIVVLLHPYFMPVLFLIAGISTRFALQKKTQMQYILNRSKKLLLPFIFGILFLMPAMTYLAAIFNCGAAPQGLIRHYGMFFTKFTDLTGADGGFSLGQFWFIIYLFIISMLSVCIISVQKKLRLSLKPSLSPRSFYLLGLPLLFLPQLLSIAGKSFAEYTYLFLLGYYIFSDENAIDTIKTHTWLFLLVGQAAAILHTYVLLCSDTQYPLLSAIAEWFMLLGLLGFAKKYLNFSGKMSNYLSKRSFAFYIWHFIWLVLFQYLIFPICKNHIILLYCIPIILSYITTFLCCELSIKIPLLRFFTGTNRL